MLQNYIFISTNVGDCLRNFNFAQNFMLFMNKNLAHNPRVLLFDLGGVVFELGYAEAISRFSALGLMNAEKQLDASVQTGIFGQLERGEIGKEDFREAFSKLLGSKVTLEACSHAWLGYLKSVPHRNLETLTSLRQRGYRLCLLSNTNPFMLDYVRSDAFDGMGHSLDFYFDKLYVSCECKMMKPEPAIFQHLIAEEGVNAADILFIDDSPRNTEAAAAIGMQTLLATSVQGWIEPLQEMLL